MSIYSSFPERPLNQEERAGRSRPTGLPHSGGGGKLRADHTLTTQEQNDDCSAFYCLVASRGFHFQLSILFANNGIFSVLSYGEYRIRVEMAAEVRRLFSRRVHVLSEWSKFAVVIFWKATVVWLESQRDNRNLSASSTLL